MLMPRTPIGMSMPTNQRQRALQVIEIAKIDTTQNMREVSQAGIEELQRSIEINGLEQPIGVYQTPKGYQLIFGARRLAAVTANKSDSILAFVYSPMTPEQAAELRLSENVHRLDPTPAETATAVSKIMETELQRLPGAQEFKLKPAWDRISPENRAKVIEATAARIGKTVGWVRDMAYLMRLSPKVMKLVQDGILPIPHAREISKVYDHAAQNEIAAAAKIHDPGENPMSISGVKHLCGKNLFRLTQVPWKLDAEFAGKPACNGCPHNTLSQPGLFERGRSCEDLRSGPRHAEHDEPKSGVCTHAPCFRHKTRAASAAASATVGKIVARRAAKPAKPKAGEKPAPPVIIPPFLQPAQIENRVKIRTERAKSHPTKQKDSKAQEKKRKQEERRRAAEQAKHELRQKTEEWGNKQEPLLIAHLRKTPGALAAFVAASLTKPMSSIQDYFNSNESMKKQLNSPQLASSIKCIASPSIKALDQIAAAAIEHHQGVINYRTIAAADLLDRIAKASGFKPTEPRPQLATPAKDTAEEDEDGDD